MLPDHSAQPLLIHAGGDCPGVQSRPPAGRTTGAGGTGDLPAWLGLPRLRDPRFVPGPSRGRCILDTLGRVQRFFPLSDLENLFVGGAGASQSLHACSCVTAPRFLPRRHRRNPEQASAAGPCPRRRDHTSGRGAEGPSRTHLQRAGGVPSPGAPGALAHSAARFWAANPAASLLSHLGDRTARCRAEARARGRLPALVWTPPPGLGCGQCPPPPRAPAPLATRAGGGGWVRLGTAVTVTRVALSEREPVPRGSVLHASRRSCCWSGVPGGGRGRGGAQE